MLEQKEKALTRQGNAMIMNVKYKKTLVLLQRFRALMFVTIKFLQTFKQLLFMNVKTHFRMILFLMGFLLLLSATAYAQGSTVTIHVTNASVRQVFDVIEQQTTYRFSYRDGLIDNRHDITLSMKNAEVSKVLGAAFKHRDITWRIVSAKSIVIYKKDHPASVKETAGTRQLHGNIVDEKGEPLIGATIYDKATQHGAITDLDGNFTIEASLGTPLTVSYVGYIDKEVTARPNMQLVLQPNTKTLDDIVVVGYGTQKKLTTTGAVNKVEGSDLGKMVQTNVEKSLQGLSPGITIVDRGGAPGSDNPEMYIRGVSTTGYATPLILVDGVEMPLNTVPAAEIDNISILKDASSSAIYGSRAANGVILVTTKRGNVGKVRVTYNGSIGSQSRAVVPECVSAREYMEMVNEALINAGNVAKYTEEQMTAAENGTDPYNISYHNWPSELYKTNYVTQHTVTLNGGTEFNKYLVSFDFLDQPGITKNTKYKRYSYRVNYDMNLKKNLTFSTDITYRYLDRAYPQSLGSAQGVCYSQTPTTPSTYEDGRYRLDQQNMNTLALVDYNVVGKNQYAADVFYGQAKLVWEPIKDLTFTGIVALNGTWSRSKIHYKNYKFYDADGNFVTQFNNPNSVTDNRNNSHEITYRFLANYKKSFGSHNFALLYGMEYINYRNEYSWAERRNLISDHLPEVSLGSADSQFAYGYPTKWGINSYFGRFNYNYKERYLFEANLRADGSSRFAKGHKWGTFPSFSAAWRLSEESFMKRVKWIDNLKLRASWGQTGNNQINDFEYLPTYSVGNVVMNGQLTTAIYQSYMANPDITWETVEQTDLGLDFNLFNNSLYGSFDYYIKDTKDILLTLAIPYYIGLGAPEQNAGKVRNSGFEAQIGYRNTFGKVQVNGALNFAYNNNKWLDRGADDGNISGYTIQKVGHSLNAYYMYKADGLIANEQDLADYKSRIKADPRGISEVKAGDVKLVDVNNDGVIDPKDRCIFDSNIPKWTYGFNLSASYKGFDLSLLFQGSLGAKRVLYGEFIEGPSYEVFTSTIFRNRWTEDNQNANADIPRLEAANNKNESTYNSFNLHNADYLRLKNAELGYTFNRSICQRIGLENLRLYISGSNLLTITSLYQGLDPESFSDRIGNFPQLKIINFGINVTF